MSITSGWYPDPDGKPTERFWDGSNWTEETRPLAPKSNKVAPQTKGKLKLGFFGWTVLAIVAVTFIGCVSGENVEGDGSTSETKIQSVTPTPDQTTQICESALSEDLETIESGMNDSKYTLTNGYVAKLQENELVEISEIFPSYKDPLIIAATIEGVESVSPVGIWAYEKYEGGGARLIALDENARSYSQWGLDATDNSPAGQVREKLYEFSLNTNVLSCARPILINGEGDGQSKPFNLDGGSYEVQFETFKDCTYFADLEAINKEFTQDLFSADSIVTGTNYVYEIPESEFYISVITGPSCSWQVTFSQIK